MDSGVREGDEISMFYDPMIAKLVTHGATRDIALDTQAAALDRFHIEGIQDNIPFVAAVMDEARYRSGDITTAYINDEFPDGFAGVEATQAQLEFIVAAASFSHSLQVERAASHFEERVTNAWTGHTDWTVIFGGEHHSVRLLIEEDPVYGDMDGASASMQFNGKTYELVTDWLPGTNLFEGTLNGVDFAVSFETRKSGLHIRHRGVAERLIVCTPRHAELYARLPEKEAPDTSKLIISPMPGLVVSMDVEVGQQVKAGEGVCIVEAMKMQNIIRAEADGVVAAINVEAGDAVAADEIMVAFE